MRSVGSLGIVALVVVACSGPEKEARTPAGGKASCAADADCVLDQQTLSTLLGAVDAAFARDRGVSPGERVALCEALAEGAGAATVPRDDGSRR